MAKQILEGVLKKSLGAFGIWHEKFQNLGFKKTPADFIVCHEDRHYLVECKEVTVNNPRFPFDRLTQDAALYNFWDQGPCFQSYVCILFRRKFLKKSDCFMIPILTWRNFERDTPKKSCRIEDLKAWLSKHDLLHKTQISVRHGGILEVKHFFQKINIQD